MAETVAPPAQQAAGSLLLRAGDRLTRAEFERRYAARPQHFYAAAAAERP